MADKLAEFLFKTKSSSESQPKQRKVIDANDPSAAKLLKKKVTKKVKIIKKIMKPKDKAPISSEAKNLKNFTNLEDLFNDIQNNKQAYKQNTAYSPAKKIVNEDKLNAKLDQMNKELSQKAKKDSLLSKKRDHTKKSPKRKGNTYTEGDVWCAKCRKFEPKDFHSGKEVRASMKVIGKKVNVPTKTVEYKPKFKEYSDSAFNKADFDDGENDYSDIEEANFDDEMREEHFADDIAQREDYIEELRNKLK